MASLSSDSEEQEQGRKNIEEELTVFRSLEPIDVVFSKHSKSRKKTKDQFVEARLNKVAHFYETFKRLAHAEKLREKDFTPPSTVSVSTQELSAILKAFNTCKFGSLDALREVLENKFVQEIVKKVFATPAFYEPAVPKAEIAHFLDDGSIITPLNQALNKVVRYVEREDVKFNSRGIPNGLRKFVSSNQIGGLTEDERKIILETPMRAFSLFVKETIKVLSGGITKVKGILEQDNDEGEPCSGFHEDPCYALWEKLLPREVQIQLKYKEMVCFLFTRFLFFSQDKAIYYFIKVARSIADCRKSQSV
jgi:hypothetical protein